MQPGRELGAENADRRQHDDVRDRERHDRGLRAGCILPAEELVRVARADVGQRADDEDPGRADGPAAEPADPRPERAGHPRERRPGVLVGAIHVVEGARDQEHRDERREQGAGRLEADDDRDRADDGGERVRGRGRRQAHGQGFAKPYGVVLELGLLAHDMGSGFSLNPGGGFSTVTPQPGVTLKRDPSRRHARSAAHSASFTATCLTRVYSSIE